MSSYKINGTTVKALEIVNLLAGREFTGLLAGEIAKSVGVSPAGVGHHLVSLEAAGWVERIKDRELYWRLAPQPVKIALAFQTAMAREASNFAEVQNRYTRTI